MVAFTKHHMGYKLGVVSLYVTTVLFFVGNYTPHWLRYSKTEHNVHLDDRTIFYRQVNAVSSALVGCREQKENGTYYSSHVFFSSESHGCGTGYHVDSATGGWVPLCQAFEVIGALALLLACIYTIRVNFCKAELGPRRRYVEAAALASGSLGFLGSVIFAGKLAGTVRGSEFYVFGWSLFLTIFISILIIVVGVVIAIFNRSTDSSAPYERIE